jgi:hypothetical protein
MNVRGSLGMMALGMLLSLPTGCLRDDGQSEKDAAIRGALKTLDTYMKALQEGDCETAYACLSWKRRKEITLAEVQEDYQRNRDRFYHRAAAKVERPQYDGFRVAVKLINGDGQVEFVALLPEEGTWRIEVTGSNYADLVRSIKAAGGPPHPGPNGSP